VWLPWPRVLSLSGLAQATARAAEAAANAAKPLEVSNTAQLRDLVASAARVFGWNKGPQTAVQVNEFRITQEQLEQMRRLCEPVAYEAPQPETPPRPFPAGYGPVDEELRITS
jgi:hypothetical protein